MKHQHARVDKADENSQSLETYDAMHKTTEIERETKDQIREQFNKYYLTIVIIWISVIHPSTDTKVESEMLSVIMHLATTTKWNQVKLRKNAEKFIRGDAKKAIAEATPLLESVLEQSSKSFLFFETLKPSPRSERRCIKSKEGAKCWRSHRSTGSRTGKMTTTN